MDKKLKIAIVTYTLQHGGLERVVSNQTLMFDSLGYEVELFVLKNEISFPYKGKLHVFDLKSKDSFLVKLRKYLKIKKAIKKGNFDFILDHRYRLSDFIEKFWLDYIYKKQRLVYFVHSGNINNYLNSKLASRSNIQFLSVSKGVEKKAKSIYPNLQIYTIYNNIEVYKSEKKFEEINDDYILAIGRMDESNVKQFDVLIACYSKSNLPKQKVKLLILGSGIRTELLKKQAVDLGLQDLVVFKGFESEVYSFYKNAKYLVLSSKHEGLGMVLIESLFCGTPVVSFDCDFGPNEIIQDRYNGLLVENQNSQKLIESMNLLLEDKNLYKTCKENALKSVEKFTKDKVQKEWSIFLNDRY